MSLKEIIGNELYQKIADIVISQGEYDNEPEIVLADQYLGEITSLREENQALRNAGDNYQTEKWQDAVEMAVSEVNPHNGDIVKSLLNIEELMASYGELRVNDENLPVMDFVRSQVAAIKDSMPFLFVAEEGYKLSVPAVSAPAKPIDQMSMDEYANYRLK